MASQVSALAEGFGTLGANIGPFVRVRSFVLVQHFFGLERLVTRLAREWSLFRVHHLHVIQQLRLGGERFDTLVASQPIFLPVNTIHQIEVDIRNIYNTKQYL